MELTQQKFIQKFDDKKLFIFLKVNKKADVCFEINQLYNNKIRMINFEILFSMMVSGSLGCGKSSFVEKLVLQFIEHKT